MDGIVDTLSIIATLVILFLIPAVLLTISYLIKRNGFYINVNCWFCNEWTKVLYADRNSFYCPFCKQYNGFNDDGGYNKVIEAQFDTSFNKQYNNTVERVKSPSNGLCNYCNNNQQLKVRQLASFVPLNEKNYDIEIEHFRAQLEKSYKLCKLCDKVLKRKLENQHAWIFGNHIKNVHKRNSPKLNKLERHNTVSKKSIFANIIRCFLILFALIVFCQAANVRINHPKSTIREYIPEIFKPYTILLNDLCHIISNVTKLVIENVGHKLNSHLTSKLRDIRIINNDILPITWLGLVMEILLLTFHPKPVLWKANELLGWIILVFTSLNIFRKDYVLYLNTVQVLCSILIIYGLLITDTYKQLSKNKKFAFKKLKSKAEKCESSDEDVSENTSSSTLGSKKSFSEKSHKFNNHFNTSQHSQNFLFQNLLKNTANLNNTFVTARSTRSPSVFNNSFTNNSSDSSSNELHHSLDNLHLSNMNFKPRSCTSPVFSVNSVGRPILSPPKLKNITQNSWTAGGFWKSDAAAFPASADVTNLSRSSSQSSGFMSSNEPAVPHMYNSLPSSREPSLHGDFEKASILSEPAYHFTPINSSCNNNQSGNSFSFGSSSVSKQCLSQTSQLYYKADNNTFYPVLRQNNMLLIQGNDIPRINFESSFSNLSLKSFNTTRNGFNTPAMFGEKPVISSLFKNIKGVSPQSHTFRAPQF